MFGSTVLEVGIGMILVYLMVSLVCTAANEALASFFGWRSKNLKEGIRNLLDGPDPQSREWVQKLYDHPLVRSLRRGSQGPSYIPSRTFALALTDLVLPAGTAAHASTAQELRTAVDASAAPPQLKQVLRLLIDEADRTHAAGKALRLEGIVDLQRLDSVFNQTQEQVEVWFNNSMERVSGWYRRRVQASTLAIAVVVTVALNVDTTLIARRLLTDSALRAAIIAQAEQMAQQPPATITVNTTPPLPGAAAASERVQESSGRVQLLQDRIAELNALGLPIGWPDPAGAPTGLPWLLLKVMGLLLTAGAASLGAPFWFDVLNKFMSVRSAGKAPEEAPKAPKQIPVPAPPGSTVNPAPVAEVAAKPS